MFASVVFIDVCLSVFLISPRFLSLPTQGYTGIYGEGKMQKAYTRQPVSLSIFFAVHVEAQICIFFSFTSRVSENWFVCLCVGAILPYWHPCKRDDIVFR